MGPAAGYRRHGTDFSGIRGGNRPLRGVIIQSAVISKLAAIWQPPRRAASFDITADWMITPPQGAAVQEKLSTAVGGDGAIQVAGGQTENPAQPGQRAVEEQTAALNNLWAAARSEEMQRPLPGKIITAYGWQENTIHKDWRFNAGVDVEPEKGDAVKAVKSGKVKEVSANSRGTQLKIDHGGGTVTSYGNLADCRVQDGQLVKQGAIIGSLGRDNRVLHFEIWQDGRSRDPGELWNGE